MAELKEGNKAPDFTAVDQDGKKVKLSSFKGKKNVVLYFYPKDMTPGCTTQACDLRDNHKNKVWQEKKLYGKTFMGIVRTTFIIDKTGTIQKIMPKVKVKTHLEDVLAVLKEL